MIAEAQVRAGIEQEWRTISSLVTYQFSAMMGATVVNVPPPSAFYNLPLVLAYSTLDSVLAQCIVEGVFPCIRRNGTPCYGLKQKMRAARTAIRWVDYSAVERGRVAR